MSIPVFPGTPEDWAHKQNLLSKAIYGKQAGKTAIQKEELKKALLKEMQKQMAHKKPVDHWKCKLYRANGLLMTEHIVKGEFPPKIIEIPVLEKITFSSTNTSGNPLKIPYQKITFKITGHSYYKGEATYKEHYTGAPLLPYPNMENPPPIKPSKFATTTSTTNAPAFITKDMWKELETQVAKDVGKTLDEHIIEVAKEAIAKKKAQNHRRRKRVFIPGMSLLKLVVGGKRMALQVPTGLPEDTTYITVLAEPNLDGFSIVVEHPDFDPVDDGEELPIVYMDFEDLPQ